MTKQQDLHRPVAKRKYRNKPVYVDGKRFDSQMEARRYEQLKLLVRAGDIEDLELQPVFEFTVDDVHIFDYYADFAYTDRVLRKWVVEDVKGVRTEVYKLKKKCVEAQHGIEIVEVRA